jgi:uncharacterized membrane protein
VLATLAPQGTLNNIQLASISGTQALLQLGVANAQYAADATVNVLQMLLVGAEIAATGKSPVALSVDLSSLSGLLPASASVTLQVISPPSLAVGEPGYVAGTTTWRTMAQTAQIVLAVNIGISTQNVPIIGSIIGLTVQLPLYLVVAQGQAWLQSAQCAATLAASTQTIGVQTGLANICIGTPLASGFTSSTVNGFSCPNSNWTVANVSLGSLNIATVSAPTIQVPLVPAQQSTLSFDGNGNPLSGNSVNSNQIGAVLNNTLSSAVTQLGALTSGNLQIVVLSNTGVGLILSALIQSIINVLSPVIMPLITAVLATLGPILTNLDTVLIGPLLQILGVQLGVATVTDYPLACGVATLVK